MGFDGRIKIDTRIDDKGFVDGIRQMSSQSLRLTNQIKQTEAEIAKLEQEASNLGKEKIPTKEYENLCGQVKKANESIIELKNTQNDLKNSGKMLSSNWSQSGKELAQEKKNFELLKTEMSKLEKAKEAFQKLPASEANNLFYNGLKEKLAAANKEFDLLLNKREKFVNSRSATKDEWKSLQTSIKARGYTISSLQSELSNFEKSVNFQDVPTKQYAELSDKIRKAGDNIVSLTKKQSELKESGKMFTAEWSRTAVKMREAKNAVEQYNRQLKEVKAVESGTDNPLYEKKAAQISKLTDKLGVLKQQLTESKQRSKGVYSGFNQIKEALSGLANKSVKTFKDINSGAKKSTSALGYFGKRLKGLLSSLLIFNVISAGFRKMTSMMSEGIQEFAKHNVDFNKSMSAMKSSLSTLRNSLGSAFAPIIQMAIPYLVKLIEYVTKAVNAIGQLFSALSGKKTFYKAAEVQEDYAGALEDTKDAADDAKKSLASFDELNVQSSNKNSASSGGGGASGGGYVEVPIDEDILKWADKLKNILKKLFAPLKKAWAKEGKFVMDAWKYALKEVGGLVSDIGRDFLTVWNQDETVKMLEDILHIFGDIGLIVGNLAHNLDEAWNKDSTGLHIIENIRDIFAIIVENIREAADYTVEWSKTLDFSPILEGFEKLTAALVPFADFVSGTLADFYTEFILPLVKFAVEDGIPQLEAILTSFFDNVKWEELRQALKNLYQAFAPYAEEFAQGLIDFFEDLMGIGTEFINSLPGPINDLADALNDGDPETANKWGYAFGVVATGLIALKLALAGFTTLKTLGELFATIANAKGVSTILGGIGKALETFAVGLLAWSPHIILAAAIAGVINEIKRAVSERVDTTGFDLFDWISTAFELCVKSIKEGIEGLKISIELWWQDTWLSNAIWNFEQWWDEKIAPWFTAEKWQGILENVRLAFEQKFEEIRTKLNEKWESIKQKITEVWESIQKFFSEKFEKIRSFAENLGQNFIDFKDKIVGAFESIKEKIRPIVEWVLGKIETIGSAISGAFGKLGGWGSGIGNKAGFSFRSASYAPMPSFAIPSPLAGVNLKQFNIPALATGTVIPPGMSQFLAVLGDNNRETEVVSPLSTLEKSVDNVMQKYMGKNDNINVNITVQCEPDGVFRVIKVENDKWKKEHGGQSAF